MLIYWNDIRFIELYRLYNIFTVFTVFILFYTNFSKLHTFKKKEKNLWHSQGSNLAGLGSSSRGQPLGYVEYLVQYWFLVPFV